MALSKNSKIEVADINAISTTATNAYNLANSKQDALGFTPIQQGGGIGQGTNKVYIGWSGSQLKCTVDQTDIGAFSFGSGNFPTVEICGSTLPSGGTWAYVSMGSIKTGTGAGTETHETWYIGMASGGTTIASRYTADTFAVKVA